MKVFDRTTEILEKALGLRLTRHSLITSNLANMDTPGYQALDFSFEEELRRAIEVTPVRLSALQGREAEANPTVYEEGSVDLDRETTRLAENTLMHDALTRLMGKKIEMIKYAINDGGK